MASPRTGSFLRNLRAAGLLDEAQLAEVESWTSAAGTDDRALAQEIVNRGVLTRFQVQQLLAGRTQGFFIGPYTVLDRIGAGGMGKVYKAVHRDMQRTVALKVLTGAIRNDPEAEARFMREVRAAAKLIHPNIVTAFDAGHEGKITYLVMEYVEGTDLYHLIKQHGRLDATTAAGIAYQVAQALQHAHEHGIVHRDMKPPNILVTDKGQAKVLDMGLARIEHAEAEGDEESATLTRDGVVMGTLDYIAPEQASDTHKADIRSDIYSLGCTLYQMLTGRVPFPGGGPTEKLYAHAMKTPDDPTTLAPDLPVDLARVLGKMLSKRPEDRYQTPAEVAEALLPWVGPSTMIPGSDVRPAPGPPSVSVGTTATLQPQEWEDAAKPPEAPVATPPPASWGTVAPPRIAPWQRIPRWVWAAGAAVVLILVAAVLFWPASEPGDQAPRLHRGGSPDAAHRGGSPGAAPGAPPPARAHRPEAPSTPTTPETVQAPAPGPPPEPDLPIVRADGSGKGPYKTLKDAFADCTPDEEVVIELRTNGVLQASGLEVTAKTFTLRAAKGYRPVLYMPPRRSPKQAKQMLLVTAEESVVVEGVHFVGRTEVHSTCLMTRAPGLTVRGCTFREAHREGQAAIWPQMPTREVIVEDSLAQGFTYFVLAWMNAGRMAVSHCANGHAGTLIGLCHVPESAAARGPIDLKLHHNTIVGADGVVSFMRPDPAAAMPERVSVSLSSNVLVGWADRPIGHVLVIAGPQGDVKVEEWRHLLDWQGRNNVIGPCGSGLQTVEHQKGGRQIWATLAPDLRTFLRTWTPNLTDTHYGSFKCPYARDSIAWDAWRRSYFERVHQSLPRSYRDAGADLSRIPEPPDVPSIVTPEPEPAAPEPKPATEAATGTSAVRPPEPVTPPPSGVQPKLLVVDPDKGPYKTLKDAFADVKPDEDVVIELRTNGVLVASDLKASCGSLVIRAGEGHRPILLRPRAMTGVSMLTLWAKRSVAVEGVHFVARHTGPAPWAICAGAPVVQVRGCTFRSVMAIQTHTGTREVSVRDCFLSGVQPVVYTYMDRGRVEIANCAGCFVGNLHNLIVRYAPDATPTPGEIELRVERNTIVRRPHWWHPFFCHTAKPSDPVPKRVTLHLERTVLVPFAGSESSGMVCVLTTEDRHAPVVEAWKRVIHWQGQHNVLGRCPNPVQVKMVGRDGTGQAYKTVVPELRTFLRTWAPRMRYTYTNPVHAPFKAEDVPEHGWRLKHVHALVKALPRTVRRTTGADLSKIPDPPPIPPVK